MKVCIFGAGYVGLVAAACFAESGNTVVTVDVDQAKIEGLKQGIIPIYEPGLKEMVLRNCAEGRLSFTTDIASAVKTGGTDPHSNAALPKPLSTTFEPAAASARATPRPRSAPAPASG